MTFSERCRQASDPPRQCSSRHPSSADLGRPLELRSLAVSDHVVLRRLTGLECDTSHSTSAPMEVDALTPPRGKAKGDKGSGKKGSGKPQKMPADEKTCHACGKLGHYASGTKHAIRDSYVS